MKDSHQYHEMQFWLDICRWSQFLIAFDSVSQLRNTLIPPGTSLTGEERISNLSIKSSYAHRMICDLGDAR